MWWTIQSALAKLAYYCMLLMSFIRPTLLMCRPIMVLHQWKKATSTVKSISYFKSLVNNIRPIIMDNISSSSSTWRRVEIFETEFKMFRFRCRNFFRNRNRNRKHPKSIFSGNENFLTAKFDLRCFLVPHFHQKTAKFSGNQLFP